MSTSIAAQNPPNDDLTHWIDRFKVVAADPHALMAPAHPQASQWHNRFFQFFEPIDTCLITWCCPAITFGKTHHRLHHDPQLRDYSPLNISCLGFCFGCCGVNIAMQLLQRRKIRERFNLEGDFVSDCLRSCCCICCTLVQADKEAEYQLAHQTEDIAQPSSKKQDMTYPVSEDPTAPKQA
ncbi:cadmimum resistance [Hyphodiscus hymeniophilus]|uniref:Cadmimum resistance n=1 Tax=Hyphodiscus hymeniophilus TaxID=353542 RepID=A0A9P7AUJ4_9HELO|nr:cadmimum resistance [Hyphodiscus hymeniophilus]